MRRRSALTVAWMPAARGLRLPALAALSVTRGAGAAVLAAPTLLAAQGPACPTAFVAWGEGGLWVGRPGAALQRLDAAGPCLVAPALTAHGLWAATGDGQLQHWRIGAQAQLVWREPQTTPIRALVASADGAHVLAAQGEQLSLLDGRGALLKRYDGVDLARRQRGVANALFHLPQRRSFVAAWPALGELWEIQLDPQAPPVFDGLVHDYRMGEGLPTPGHLGVRRSPLGMPMPALMFADTRAAWLAGQIGDELVVVHLDVRRRIAAFALPGARTPGALLWQPGREAAMSWWVPHGAAVQTIDPARWALGPRLVLPAAVRGLQPLASGAVAWVGEGAGSLLLAWRDGAWQPLAPGLAGLHRWAVDPAGAHLLVATAQPELIQLLDAEGRVLQRWPMPAGCDGLAWCPRPS